MPARPKQNGKMMCQMQPQRRQVRRSVERRNHYRQVPAGKAVLGGIDVQIVLLAVHESRKGGKEIVSIGGAR